MPHPPVRTALLVGGLAVAAAGCGNSEASPSVSTRAVTSTAYVTIPARPTTTTDPPPPAADVDDEPDDEPDAEPAAEPAAEPEAPSAIDEDPTRERTYEIQAGDYLVGIAGDFDVPLDNLVAYNGWPDGTRHALVPGAEIRIPPSDYDPDGSAPSGGTAEVSASDDTTAGECPDGEPAETYTIEAGDIPALVAERLGTTVDELEAANTDTVGYRGFVVGIEINVPC